PEVHFRMALEYLTISKQTFQGVWGSAHPNLLPIYTKAAEIRLTHLKNEPDEIRFALDDLLEAEKIIDQFQKNDFSQRVYEGLMQCHRLLSSGEQAILEYQEKLDKVSQKQEV